MNQVSLFIAQHGWLVAAFALVVILFIVNEMSASFSGIKLLPPEQVVHWLNRKEAVVVDIRDVATFKGGHIVNAVNVPRETLSDAVQQKLNKYKSKPIVVCCANGQNSVKAASHLKREGFTELACLKGGITAWRSASLPVTKA